VDPGGDLAHIEAAVQAEALRVEKILVTHGHIDHCGGAAKLAERLAVPIEGPNREDAFWLAAMSAQAANFGYTEEVKCFTPTRWLDEGGRVTLGELELEVLHCPGHTPGHVVFYHAPSRLIQVGDVIFNNSIGRTDFPRGDYGALMHSIREKLFPLGDEVEFICGHGPNSTFGAERRDNPFVSDDVIATDTVAY